MQLNNEWMKENKERMYKWKQIMSEREKWHASHHPTNKRKQENCQSACCAPLTFRFHRPFKSFFVFIKSFIYYSCITGVKKTDQQSHH